MDEAVRIYTPVKNFPKESEQKPKRKAEKIPGVKKPKHAAKREPKKKFWFDCELWKSVINEKGKAVHELEQKYPWFDILHNWVTCLLIVALFVSFGIWAVDIHTKRTATAYAAAAVAEKEAEHQAILEKAEADRRAEQQSIENQMKHAAQVKARIAYGSRNFIDKFHYGDADFMTLYQCIDNRLKNGIYTGMTIDDIANQENQWVGYFESNPVENYYYNLAMKSEQAKQNRVSQPIGTDYIYTVYTEHGIYLTNDPKAPQYTWWHYSE